MPAGAEWQPNDSGRLRMLRRGKGTREFSNSNAEMHRRGAAAESSPWLESESTVGVWGNAKKQPKNLKAREKEEKNLFGGREKKMRSSHPFEKMQTKPGAEVE